jgi:hypothetical protein
MSSKEKTTKVDIYASEEKDTPDCYVESMTLTQKKLFELRMKINAGRKANKKVKRWGIL